MNRANVAKQDRITADTVSTSCCDLGGVCITWMPAWNLGLTRLSLGMALAAILIVSGCSTTKPNIIPASELPIEFRAANQGIRAPLDLSFLASRSLNNDLVYPGDVLDISIVSGAEETPPEPLPYRVNEDGTLDLPIVGRIPISGLTMTGAEEQIRQYAIGNRIYRDPKVSVLLSERLSDKIRVVGAVEEPGDYDIPRAGSDLLAAIVAAGGLSEDAGEAIEIRHRTVVADDGVARVGYEPPAPQTVQVNLADAMAGRSQDYSLRDGSVVMVTPHVPRTVYVLGLVKHDGEFELPKDQPLRVTQAVALAGGREIEFADRVYVTRFVEGRPEPVVFEVSFKEAKSSREANPVLMPGDIVSVEETPTTFVVDFIRNFFRVGLTSAIPGF